MGGAGRRRPAPQPIQVEEQLRSSITHFVATFIADESGQDLVEYALLAMFVALATMAGLKAIENAIGAEYVGWDTDEQNLWIPPDP